MASESLIVNDRLSVPMEEIELSFVRSSGPGGQNVNKVNSKAQLRWYPRANTSLPPDVRDRFLARYATTLTVEGAVVLSSQQHRDQPSNTADCLEKLRAMIAAVALPPRRRKKTRPGRGAIERRLERKRATSDRKRDRRRSYD
ncbi:MAG: aminoacyl-tRNA hydrolase [Planctomycetes bacterium]|nr:aminoacyl-tRNA hydrolase [Planctomycetota bacterium]